MAPGEEAKVNPSTVSLYWEATLGIGAAVIAVVGLLLVLITRTAEDITEGAAAVWQVGQFIARNTVHVPILGRVNRSLSNIGDTAADIEAVSARLEQDAERIARAATRKK